MPDRRGTLHLTIVAAIGRSGTYARVVGDIDDRLRELLEHRRHLPGSIAVMETHAEASMINMHLCELENLTMRLAVCWDGEPDPIGAFSQLSYLHEKAERAEEAARHIREAVERIRGLGSGATPRVAALRCGSPGDTAARIDGCRASGPFRWTHHGFGRSTDPPQLHRPSSKRVRPLGFEPRTCGLRVRCS